MLKVIHCLGKMQTKMCATYNNHFIYNDLCVFNVYYCAGMNSNGSCVAKTIIVPQLHGIGVGTYYVRECTKQNNLFLFTYACPFHRPTCIPYIYTSQLKYRVTLSISLFITRSMCVCRGFD